MISMKTIANPGGDVKAENTGLDVAKGLQSGGLNGSEADTGLEQKSFHGVLNSLTEKQEKMELGGSNLPVASELAKGIENEISMADSKELAIDAPLLMAIADMDIKKMTKEAMPASAVKANQSVVNLNDSLDQGMANNNATRLNENSEVLSAKQKLEMLELASIDIKQSEADALSGDKMNLISNKSITSSVSAPVTAITGAAEAIALVQTRLSSSSAMPVSESSSLLNHQTTITEEFASARWGESFSKQVVWMSNQNVNSAELRLNPANLGPIEVRIEMEDEQINVSFSSRNAVVREAVEQALPRLREMFEQSGLNLSESNVSQQSFSERQGEQQEIPGASEDLTMLMTGEENISADALVNIEQMESVAGAVDYYI